MNLKDLIDTMDAHSIWEDQFSLNRNEFLVQRGEKNDRLYYIIEGSLRIYMIDEDNEQCIRFAYPESFISALDSYISGSPSEFYIQAIKGCKIKSLSRSRFEKFMNEMQGGREAWIRLLEGLVFQQLERERDILTSSPHERYQRVLKRSPQLFQEIPNKYIASYLRMTPETLSRIKNLDLNQ